MKKQINCFSTKSLIAAAALAVCGITPQAKAYDWINWNTERNYSTPSFSAGSVMGDDYLTPTLNRIRAGVFQVPDATINFSSNDHNTGSPSFTYFPAYFNFELRAVDNHVFDWDSGTLSAASFNLTGDNLLPIESTALRLWRRLDNTDGTVELAYSFGYNERNFQTARTGQGINGDDNSFFTPAFAADNSFAINSVFQVADTLDFTPRGSVVRNGNITLGLVNGIEVLDGLYAKDAGWLDIRGDLTLYGQGTLYIRDAEVTSGIYRNDNVGIGGEGEGLYATRGTLAFDSGILSVRQRFAQDMAVNEGQTLGFRDGAVNATNFDITGGGYWQTSDLVGGVVIGGGNFYSPFGEIGGFMGFGGEGDEEAQLYMLLGGGAVRSITGENIQNGNITIGQVAPTDFGGYFGGEGIPFNYARINADRYEDAGGETVRSILTINGNINGVNGLSSDGGSIAIFGGDGDIIVNGQIGAGVSAVYKDGQGELVLTRANVYGTSSFESSTFVTSGSIRATHANAFGLGRVETTGFGLKELVGLVGLGGEGEGISTAGGSVILDLGDSPLSNHTIANEFRLGGYGQADGIFGEGEGQLAAGTGKALTTSSLVNESGDNTITGGITIGSSLFSLVGVSPGGPSEFHNGSILAKNGTTLTITGDVSATYDTGARTRLFLGAVNDGPLHGQIIVEGTFFGIAEVIKNGNGDVSIATVDGALDAVYVNAGTLRINASHDSTALVPYGGFGKYGSGKLEVYGTHHYSYFGFNGGTSDISGSITLQGFADDGNFDINSGSTVNIKPTGSLVHVSTDGTNPSAYVTAFGISGASTLNVESGGVVNLNGAGIRLGDTSSVIVVGTLTAATISTTLTPTINVQAGGILNASIVTDAAEIDGASAAVITVSGALNGNIGLNQDSTVEVTTGGVITGDITADHDSVVTLRTGGSIIGNVETFSDARFVIETGSIHTGDYKAYGDAVITVNGTIGEGSQYVQNFLLSGDARLKGSGTIAGSLEQTGGVVAPGNSPGILTVGGNYSISSGSLQIEIEGLAGAGQVTGHDQLRVGGTITISGTANLDFAHSLSYDSQRGAGFQVLADTAGAAKASIGRFDTVLWLDYIDSRVLFDHSTGRAYGTGLSYGQGGNSFQTFRNYADNANRLEIARALWMESIDYEGTDLGLDGEGAAVVDENFATTATDVAAAQAKRGYKAFILTSGTVGAQTATDLGQAAVGVLTAGDVGAALDALSPEAYAGITDLGIRVARGFAFLPFNQRRMGAVNEWDFSVGYNNDEVESAASSSYNSYKVRSSQVNVTAARDLSANARFTLGVGRDEGKVLATNFSADVDTLGLGLGLALTPDSKAYRLDIGVAFTSSDWDSTRQGVTAGDDMDTMAFAARLTINTKAEGNFSYKPFAALSYTDANVDSFVEADAPGSVQLGVSGFGRKSLLGELGMDFEYKFGAKTSLTGIVSWQHEFQDSGATDMTAEFAEDGVDDTAFSVRAAGFGQDFFRAGLGLRHELSQNSAVSLSYNAIFGSDIGSGHQFRADYSFRF